MAYDRYDTRRGSRDHDRHSDDRERGHSGREERGFFERAGEQIASWFGDEDDDDGRPRGRGEYRGDPMHGHEGNYGTPRSRDYGAGRSPDRGSERERSNWSPAGDQRSSSERQPWGGGNERGGGDRGSYRPMAGDYGRRGSSPRGGDFGRGEYDRPQSNWDRDEYRRTSFAGSTDRSQHHDPHYQEWRQRQIEALDRDYEEYRREHHSKFENDFGGWRDRRQTKRQMLGQIREHMQVVGSDDQPVGTVDRVAGDRIVLTKSDPEAGGVHHSLGCTDIDRVEGDRVILDKSADQARQSWRDETRDRALFEREDQGEDGPHMLDRSFSGTYR